jgi:small nuclear ribonucleoprotein (snRNP)-like protein
MGKRLKRIMNFEIVANLKELQNKEVDLVLANNTTLHGYIKQIDSQMAVLEDKRFERHQLKLDDIVEIVFDFEAPN